jgi:hypothetical protein
MDWPPCNEPRCGFSRFNVAEPTLSYSFGLGMIFRQIEWMETRHIWERSGSLPPALRGRDQGGADASVDGEPHCAVADAPDSFIGFGSSCAVGGLIKGEYLGLRLES